MNFSLGNFDIPKVSAADWKVVLRGKPKSPTGQPQQLLPNLRRAVGVNLKLTLVTFPSAQSFQTSQTADAATWGENKKCNTSTHHNCCLFSRIVVEASLDPLVVFAVFLRTCICWQK